MSSEALSRGLLAPATGGDRRPPTLRPALRRTPRGCASPTARACRATGHGAETSQSSFRLPVRRGWSVPVCAWNHNLASTNRHLRPRAFGLRLDAILPGNALVTMASSRMAAGTRKGGITRTVAIPASATAHRSTSRGTTNKPLEFHAMNRPRKRGNFNQACSIMLVKPSTLTSSPVLAVSNQIQVRRDRIDADCALGGDRCPRQPWRCRGPRTSTQGGTPDSSCRRHPCC